MGSTELKNITQQAETSGNALSATADSPSSAALLRTRQVLFDLHKHLSLLRQMEELRSVTGHNFGEADGLTSGASHVTIVAAPSSGFFRRVEFISVYNADNAGVTILLKKNNGSGRRVFHRETLSTLTHLNTTAPIILSSSDSLEIVLTGAVSSVESDWVVSWRDYDSL